MTLKYTFTPGELLASFVDGGRPMEDALSRTMLTLSSDIKAEGRAAIIGAGLGKRFSQTLTTKVFPPDGKSLKAALIVYSRASYSQIFEEGGEIRPRSAQYLWIPFSNMPKKLGRGQFNFRRFKDRYGLSGLRYIHQPGKPPMYGIKVKRKRPGISTNRIGLSKLAVGSEQGGNVFVPVFFGVKSVSIPKKLNIGQIVDKNLNRFAALYFQNLRDQ